MTSEPGPRSFTVILERGSPCPAAEVGRLVAYHLELHPTDAIVRVRYGAGLVVDGVTEAVADELIARLAEIGVRARKVDGDLWALVPRGVRAFGLEFGERSLVVRLVGGRRIEVPRDSVFALHGYGLPGTPPDEDDEEPFGRKKRKAKRQAAAGGSLSLGSLGAAHPTEPPPTAAADEEAAQGEPEILGAGTGELSLRGQKLHKRLVELGAQLTEFHLALYADPLGPIRVRKNDFDFTCLGVDRQEHSLDNFLTLIERSLDYLPAAWNREPCEALLKDLNPRSVILFKPEEVQNLERWLYQWSRIEAESAADAAARSDSRPNLPSEE